MKISNREQTELKNKFKKKRSKLFPFCDSSYKMKKLLISIIKD